MLEFLLQIESDPNAQTDEGETAFNIIRDVFGEDHSLFETLLRFGSEESAEL